MNGKAAEPTPKTIESSDPSSAPSKPTTPAAPRAAFYLESNAAMPGEQHMPAVRGKGEMIRSNEVLLGVGGWATHGYSGSLGECLLVQPLWASPSRLTILEKKKKTISTEHAQTFLVSISNT